MTHSVMIKNLLHDSTKKDMKEVEVENAEIWPYNFKFYSSKDQE